MPNHIHLILIPPKQESLRLAISYTHEQYSKSINLKKNGRVIYDKDDYKKFENRLSIWKQRIYQNTRRGKWGKSNPTQERT